LDGLHRGYIVGCELGYRKNEGRDTGCLEAGEAVGETDSTVEVGTAVDVNDGVREGESRIGENAEKIGEVGDAEDDAEGVDKGETEDCTIGDGNGDVKVGAISMDGDGAVGDDEDGAIGDENGDVKVGAISMDGDGAVGDDEDGAIGDENGDVKVGAISMDGDGAVIGEVCTVVGVNDGAVYGGKIVGAVVGSFVLVVHLFVNTLVPYGYEKG